ncbi:hypothetical protein L1887_53706 [Cichorium endivia]|nr:hypothetical protein L1887_53706 [Cichorium endivia]
MSCSMCSGRVDGETHWDALADSEAMMGCRMCCRRWWRCDGRVESRSKGRTAQATATWKLLLTARRPSALGPSQQASKFGRKARAQHRQTHPRFLAIQLGVVALCIRHFGITCRSEFDELLCLVRARSANDGETRSAVRLRCNTERVWADSQVLGEANGQWLGKGLQR